MTPEQALAILRAYKTGRAHLDEAVRTLHGFGLSQARIVQESGLSREGVRKILARQADQTTDSNGDQT